YTEPVPTGVEREIVLFPLYQDGFHLLVVEQAVASPDRGAAAGGGAERKAKARRDLRVSRADDGARQSLVSHEQEPARRVDETLRHRAVAVSGCVPGLQLVIGFDPRIERIPTQADVDRQASINADVILAEVALEEPA